MDKRRAVQMTRLERIRRAVWPRVLAGESDAVARAIRVEERVADMLGIPRGTT